MATVSFSVPEEVKRAFDATFAGRNKSAVIARLMQEAVDAEQRKQGRADAIDQLQARRAQRPPVSNEELRAARKEARERP